MEMPRSPMQASIADAHFELVPIKGAAEQIGYLPPEAATSVTASPSHGTEATVELAKLVAARGHATTAHLSARLIADRQHLDRTLEALSAGGVTGVFVVAGDATEAAGPYEGAADLLEEMASLGYTFDEVGITGYPEGHPFLSDQVIADARARKLPHATYLLSQICYEPDTIRRWVSDLRKDGVTLPIRISLPGVVDRKRLLRISMRIGLGDSIRYLRKQHRVAGHLLAGYQPDELLRSLEDLLDDPVTGLAGLHLSTFNEVQRTEQWRRRVLAEAEGRPANG